MAVRRENFKMNAEKETRINWHVSEGKCTVSYNKKEYCH